MYVLAFSHIAILIWDFSELSAFLRNYQHFYGNQNFDPLTWCFRQEGILPAREWQSATSGNIYTVEPPLVEIDQPPVVPAPSTSQSRSWGPANETSQPSFDPHATQEKGSSKIHLEPPSYNDAVHMWSLRICTEMHNTRLSLFVNAKRSPKLFGTVHIMATDDVETQVDQIDLNIVGLVLVSLPAPHSSQPSNP